MQIILNVSVRSGQTAIRGFTLLEVAVVVFVSLLLLGGMLVPLSTQVEQRQISNTRKTMDEIREALIGHAVTNRYLPCPAISATNGREDRTDGICTGGKRHGYVPWETLGITTRADVWGHLFRYSVTLSYASGTAPFSLDTAPDITVQARNPTGALINVTNANSVPAIVISHGKNGYGSVDVNGTVQGLPAGWPAGNADENTNVTNATTFVSRTQQGANAGGAGGEFDDLAAWVSRYTLSNRMVAAGQLP